MKVIFEKLRSFFADRRKVHADLSQEGMIERRDKHNAQFKRVDEWYLSASIDVEEVSEDEAIKDMAEHGMSPEQIAEAKKKADTWLEKHPEK